jgi:hypothetical protein
MKGKYKNPSFIKYKIPSFIKYKNPSFIKYKNPSLIKYAYTNGLGSDQPVLYRHMCVPVPNQDLDFQFRCHGLFYVHWVKVRCDCLS